MKNKILITLALLPILVGCNSSSITNYSNNNEPQLITYDYDFICKIWSTTYHYQGTLKFYLNCDYICIDNYDTITSYEFSGSFSCDIDISKFFYNDDDKMYYFIYAENRNSICYNVNLLANNVIEYKYDSDSNWHEYRGSSMSAWNDCSLSDDGKILQYSDQTFTAQL